MMLSFARLRKKAHSLVPNLFEILNDIQLPPKRPLR